MKTVDFNSSNRSLIRSMLVLGALTGLYFYFRRGGSLKSLSAMAASTWRGIGEHIPSQVDSLGKSVRSTANEIATNAEEIERFHS
jgi:hypothetical protein